MTGKTICVLSDSCAAPVVSGIKKFRGEFEEYLNGRRKPVVAACKASSVIRYPSSVNADPADTYG